jgi:hypothetical protein
MGESTIGKDREEAKGKKIKNQYFVTRYDDGFKC